MHPKHRTRFRQQRQGGNLAILQWRFQGVPSLDCPPGEREPEPLWEARGSWLRMQDPGWLARQEQTPPAKRSALREPEQPGAICCAYATAIAPRENGRRKKASE